MCGIAGVIRSSLLHERDIHQANVMAETMRHRGPDDDGSCQGDHYAFCHRRLSIIDLEGGHQPLANEDGSVWLVYNGEIYNFLELGEELAAKGHVFKTRCDTEVIVHLYEEYGPQCVERLNGMFAFALFDENSNSFFMVRDRAGIKPLYYSFDGGALRFASEAKAIVKVAGQLPAADRKSVVDFFALSLVQEDRTAFEDIRQLLPGHYLTWDLEKAPALKRYWRLSYATKTDLDDDELRQELGGLIDDAVRTHLVSDVSVGTYLSGGLDSSLISAIARDFLPHGLNTFSAGFVGNEAVDERIYAREAAAMIGSKHHEVEVGPDNFLENLRKIVWHMDEPTLSPGVYPYYFLCGLVSDTVKVVLGGQGSDELFGGYPRYRMALLERDISESLGVKGFMRLPGFLNEYRHRYGAGALKNELMRLKAGDNRRIYEIVSGFHPRRLSHLFSDQFKRSVGKYDPFRVFSDSINNCDSDDLIDRMLFNDFQNMLASILRTEDRMSMAHSIESRVPLLDYRLVELTALIPSSAKVSGDQPKVILKEVAEGRVPESIIKRRKQGFSAPVDSWLTGALAEEVEEFLLGSRAMSRGYFSKSNLEQMYARCIRQKKDIWRIWSLINFEMWNRVFLDGEVPQ